VLGEGVLIGRQYDLSNKSGGKSIPPCTWTLRMIDHVVDVLQGQVKNLVQKFCYSKIVYYCDCRS